VNEYKTIIPLVREVAAGIKGRLADEQDSTAIMAWYALQAGHGNHLDIGAMHGGSAIVVAMLKVRHSQRGKVFTVDPLTGYYFDKYGYEKDNISGVAVDRATLDYNIWQFGVEDIVEVVEANSYPWPKALSRKKFVSAYIDGYHWGDGPQKDWNNVKNRVSRYVIFDNYEDEHPEIAEVCDKAAASRDWNMAYQVGITFVLERVNNED